MGTGTSYFEVTAFTSSDKEFSDAVITKMQLSETEKGRWKLWSHEPLAIAANKEMTKCQKSLHPSTAALFFLESAIFTLSQEPYMYYNFRIVNTEEDQDNFSIDFLPLGEHSTPKTRQKEMFRFLYHLVKDSTQLSNPIWKDCCFLSVFNHPHLSEKLENLK